jgi:hypothetical protein
MVIATILPVGAAASSQERPVTHKMIQREVSETPSRTQVRATLVVSGDVTAQTLEDLLGRVHEEISRETGFKYHPNPTHVAIYAFPTRAHAESGTTRWIGMLVRRSAKSNPEVRVDESRIAAMKLSPETKFGLPEPVRIRVWRELVRAERRAQREAELHHPIAGSGSPDSASGAITAVEKQQAARGTLREKYELEVGSRYGLGREELGEIRGEGLRKNWPLPK